MTTLNRDERLAAIYTDRVTGLPCTISTPPEDRLFPIEGCRWISALVKTDNNVYALVSREGYVTVTLLTGADAGHQFHGTHVTLQPRFAGVSMALWNDKDGVRRRMLITSHVREIDVIEN
jgi:hypothetical protein